MPVGRAVSRKYAACSLVVVDGVDLEVQRHGQTALDRLRRHLGAADAHARHQRMRQRAHDAIPRLVVDVDLLAQAGGDRAQLDGALSLTSPGSWLVRHALQRCSDPYPRRVTAASVRLLFVCAGNICRSPTAEAVMRGLLRRDGLEDVVAIDSAGTGGWHVGEPPDRRSRAARPRCRSRAGLDGAARQVRRADFADYDLLLAADAHNAASLRAIAPDAEAAGEGPAPARVRPGVARGSGDLDVPDPYYGGQDGFEHVLDVVEAGLRGVARRPAGPGPRVREALAAALGGGRGGDVDLAPVAGGDLNDAFRATLAGGHRRVRQDERATPRRGPTGRRPPGLRWLGEAQAMRTSRRCWRWTRGGGAVPRAGEWIEAGGRAGRRGGGSAADWRPCTEQVRRRPARCRRAWAGGLRVGPLLLPNGASDGDWPAFYAANRLLPLVADEARDRGALDAAGARGRSRRVADRITGRWPARRSRPRGCTATCGWATCWPAPTGVRASSIRRPTAATARSTSRCSRLFGRPSAAFFAAYEEAWPLADGRGPDDLWQLFPLLVHAVLFGGGYGAWAARAAARYV